VLRFLRWGVVGLVGSGVSRRGSSIVSYRIHRIREGGGYGGGDGDGISLISL
jgi:hypothetical protein